MYIQYTKYNKVLGTENTVEPMRHPYTIRIIKYLQNNYMHYI